MNPELTAGLIRFVKRSIIDSSEETNEPGPEPWKWEYRSTDLDLSFDQSTADSLRKSIRDYSFTHPDGMLQYQALPGLKYKTEKPLRIGQTPLFPLPTISGILGAEIFLKSEGHNLSGCFKDRETMMCLLHSRQEKLSRAVIYSSGNAAASAAIFAQKNQLHLITCVSGDTYEEKIDFIRAHGSDVIVIGDEYTNFETGYRLFATLNAEGYFRNHGYDNWSVTNPYRVQGDKTTSLEIAKQLEPGIISAPDYVIVPTANGSCLAGMWKGFKELHQLGMIDKLPKMVSAGIKNANPVCKAVKNGILDQPVRCNLDQLDPEDAHIGSIILAEEGYDSIEAARAVVESGGTAVEVQCSDIESAYHLLLEKESHLAEHKNMMPEPASVISLSAVEKLKMQEPITANTKIVSVITGSGYKSRQKIREIMADDPQSLQMVDETLNRRAKEQYPDAKHSGQKLVVSADQSAVLAAFNQLKEKS